MMMITQLWSVLEVLAVVGLVATGIENVPGVAAAHKAAVRGPQDHHRHLAARMKVERGVGAQEKVLVRRKADGSKCRVRGAAFTASSSTSTTSSTAPTSPATAAATAAATNAVAAVQAQQQQPAAPSSSSVAPAPAPAPSPPSNNNNGGGSVGGAGRTGGWTNVGSKYGTAWPNGNWATAGSSDYFGNYVGSKNSWYYTWSPYSVGSADQLGVEYVPMLWGPNQVGDWWSQQSQWPSTVKNALFFNEPNHDGQSNVAAGDAVSFWMNNMVPLRSKGIALGGAATTSAPSGLQWIQDFKKLCPQYGNSAADCAMDFVPVHWYDTTPENFQQYITNFHNAVGGDFWVTEYACQNFNGGAQCSDGDTWHLHQTMAAWFDEQDYIKRYSPFGVMKNMQDVNQNNALMNPDGSITALGSWYINSA